MDEYLRTSDENIYAVGDVIEVKHVVTGEYMLLPLAGPANRQGRLAADNICGRATPFRGVEATAICGLFGLELASAGANTAMLKRAGMAFETVRLHPGHHVSYFPGSHPIHMKIFFDPSTGRVLGGQGVGEAGVARRIDVLAMAIQAGSTVHDLADAELCYAPQFGAAKDPINMAGMIAANVVNGDVKLASWDDVLAAGEGKYLVLDVRTAAEFQKDHLPGMPHTHSHTHTRAHTHIHTHAHTHSHTHTLTHSLTDASASMLQVLCTYRSRSSASAWVRFRGTGPWQQCARWVSGHTMRHACSPSTDLTRTSFPAV